jgi:uncharacterized membrane-anchored protein
VVAPQVLAVKSNEGQNLMINGLKTRVAETSYWLAIITFTCPARAQMLMLALISYSHNPHDKQA